MPPPSKLLFLEDRKGKGWRGLGCGGMEWGGEQRLGEDWSGMDWAAQESRGLDWRGMVLFLNKRMPYG